MKVLSLFDGMSCGQLALYELGLSVDTYYASEVDKYAIEIAQKNFPNTKQIGDVRTVKAADLPQIDLLMGGSPCQGFSFAGRQLNFDDPRSALFFEFVRLLRECKPKYFLLENVRMKKEYQDVITEHLGVEPIMINSSLVSAQNRVRLYWTNIPNIEQPQERGIVLADILDNSEPYRFFADHDGGNQLNPSYKSQANKLFDKDNKSPTISAGTHGYALGYLKDDGIPKWLESERDGKRRIDRVKTPKDKARTLTATMWKGHEEGYVKKPIQVGSASDINGHDILKRIYSPNGKSPTLNAHGGGNTEPKVAIADTDEYVKGIHYRKLTPLECERLQTIPDNYTEGVSNTQRYKMIGNGWTIEVIKHILKNIKGEYNG
jgi:DNA-cytosine methyltransferase